MTHLRLTSLTSRDQDDEVELKLKIIKHFELYAKNCELQLYKYFRDKILECLSQFLPHDTCLYILKFYSIDIQDYIPKLTSDKIYLSNKQIYEYPSHFHLFKTRACGIRVTLKAYLHSETDLVKTILIIETPSYLLQDRLVKLLKRYYQCQLPVVVQKGKAKITDFPNLKHLYRNNLRKTSLEVPLVTTYLRNLMVSGFKPSATKKTTLDWFQYSEMTSQTKRRENFCHFYDTLIALNLYLNDYLGLANAAKIR